MALAWAAWRSEGAVLQHADERARRRTGPWTAAGRPASGARRSGGRARGRRSPPPRWAACRPWSRRPPGCRRRGRRDRLEVEAGGRGVGQPRPVQVDAAGPWPWPAPISASSACGRIDRAIFGGVGQRQRGRRLAVGDVRLRPGPRPGRAGSIRPGAPGSGDQPQALAEEARRAGLVGADVGVLVGQHRLERAAERGQRHARWPPCRRPRSAPRRRRPAVARTQVGGARRRWRRRHSPTRSRCWPRPARPWLPARPGRRCRRRSRSGPCDRVLARRRLPGSRRRSPGRCCRRRRRRRSGPAPASPVSAAASGRAPAPSAMIRAFSAISRMARRVWSRVTTMLPSTSGFIRSHMRGKTLWPPAPSTNEACHSGKGLRRAGGEGPRGRRGGLGLGASRP